MADPFAVQQGPHDLFPFTDGVPIRDADAHLIARSALLNLLGDDARVRDLFRTFEGAPAIACPLWEAAELISLAVDAFAIGYGWRDRFEMAEDPTRFEVVESDLAPVRELRETFPWTQAGEPFQRATEHLVFAIWNLMPRARWQWLAVDLVRLFRLELARLMGRRDLVLGFWREKRTPTLDVSFTTRPNESATEARRRLRDWYRQADAALGPVAVSEKRGAFGDPDTIARDVRWFYRATLKQSADPIRALAREYHREAHGHEATFNPNADHRATVQAGIKRARRLLGGVLHP